MEDNVVYENNLGGVRLRGSIPVSMDGCDVYGNGRTGIYLDKEALANISNSHIYDNRRSGINIDKAAVVTVEGNRIHGNDNGGIRLWRTPGEPNHVEVTVTGNRIYGNKQGGIRSMLPSHDALVLQVIGNAIYRNGRSGIRVENNTTLIARQNDVYENAVAGIVSYISDVPPTLDIYQNRVAFNATAGIHVVNGKSGSIGIRNNWVFHNDRAGILCGLWGAPDEEDLDIAIINNTVVSNGSVEQGVGIRNESSGRAVVINNIVAYNYITGIRTKECYDESYNLLFANGDIGSCCDDPLSAPYWIERTQFAGCPERGKGDLVCDPLFVDSDNYDFTLRDTSLAIDGGKDGSGYHDIPAPTSRGTARNDMGATGGPYADPRGIARVWPPRFGEW
jgi:hypothetical protein